MSNGVKSHDLGGQLIIIFSNPIKSVKGGMSCEVCSAVLFIPVIVCVHIIHLRPKKVGNHRSIALALTMMARLTTISKRYGTTTPSAQKSHQKVTISGCIRRSHVDCTFLNSRILFVDVLSQPENKLNKLQPNRQV